MTLHSMTMHAVDRKNSDAAACSAINNGWKVHRRAYDYFVALRGQEQIAVWARGGELLSSRTEITTDMDRAVSWMQTPEPDLT